MVDGLVVGPSAESPDEIVGGVGPERDRIRVVVASEVAFDRLADERGDGPALAARAMLQGPERLLGESDVADYIPRHCGIAIP